MTTTTDTTRSTNATATDNSSLRPRADRN
jgi:hypothetical protein